MLTSVGIMVINLIVFKPCLNANHDVRTPNDLSSISVIYDVFKSIQISFLKQFRRKHKIVC